MAKGIVNVKSSSLIYKCLDVSTFQVYMELRVFNIENIM